MADIEYTHDVYGAEAYADEDVAQAAGSAPVGKTVGKAVNVLGALASLALVVGVGVWGYRLLMRDVSGVPVVRALEGPMRVQPEDPGGQPADHQGLAVNTVAAEGTAAPPPDRLVLAPRPVRLTEEDSAMGLLSAAAPAPQKAVARRDKPAGDAVVAALVRELTAGDSTPGTAAGTAAGAATQASLTGQIVQPEPLALAGSDGTDAKPGSEPDPASAVQAAVLTGPGLARSLRPMTRPARLASIDADVAAAIRSAVDASADLDVDPDTLPAGTRLAQLGAYDSPEIARAEWDRLNARFEDYLDGKKRVIQQASSGGRTFYRLRAMGFDDLSDARRFCSALVAENADCIPVTTR